MDFENINIKEDLQEILENGRAENYISNLVAKKDGSTLFNKKEHMLYKSTEDFLINCLQMYPQDPNMPISPIRDKIYELIFQGDNLTYFAGSPYILDEILVNGLDYAFMEHMNKYRIANNEEWTTPALKEFKRRVIKNLCSMTQGDLRNAYKMEIFEIFFQTPSESLNDDEFIDFINTNLFLLERYQKIDTGEISKWIFGSYRNIDVTELDFLKGVSVHPAWITADIAPKILGGVEKSKVTKWFVNTYIQICKIGRTNLVIDFYNMQTPMVQQSWETHPNFEELEELVNEYLEQQEI
jgi:hypothetical protein